ncbi:hypothetical protein [uncultured Nocardioides sp.]|uniref:hypothetical protein n=1 Tax=uncultured Nocardioides sp. TaxID=198441 RepID=UPI00262531C6|nr:hypothetical protein [uncultured Nocardioides sp.]
MVRDLALAALVGPGLVLGLATTLDQQGVLAVEGMWLRVVTVSAVALALCAFVLLSGLRRAPSPRRRPRRRGRPG